MTNIMLNLLTYFLFTSASHVSVFLLAHLQRQVCIFGSGSRLLGADTIPRRLEPLSKLHICL
jgi:hypothetical protein